MPNKSKADTGRGKKRIAADANESLTAKLLKMASGTGTDTLEDQPGVQVQENFSSILSSRTTYNDIKVEMEDLFKMQIPIDFFDFFEFVKMRMKIDDVDDDLVGYLAALGLRFGGMYDYLLGKRSENKEDYILHHRYYYDTPEFQTVLIDAENEYLHIGYYRDDPKSNPAFVAFSDASQGCKLSVVGNSIFNAVRKHMEKKCKTKSTTDLSKGKFGAKTKAKAKPKEEDANEIEVGLAGVSREVRQKRKAEMSQRQWKEELQRKFRASLASFMEQNGYLFNMSKMTDLNTRNKKVVTILFHTGLVVPVDDQGIGWRDFPRTYLELRQILTSINEEKKDCKQMKEELEEIISLVQFANDECDPGLGYALGLLLFTFGGEKLHGYIKSVLPMAYQLLEFTQFGEIHEIHMKNRTKDVPVYLK